MHPDVLIITINDYHYLDERKRHFSTFDLMLDNKVWIANNV